MHDGRADLGVGPGVVPVQDSKLNAGSPVIVVGSANWTEFIRTVGAGAGTAA